MPLPFTLPRPLVLHRKLLPRPRVGSRAWRYEYVHQFTGGETLKTDKNGHPSEEFTDAQLDDFARELCKAQTAAGRMCWWQVKWPDNDSKFGHILPRFRDVLLNPMALAVDYPYWEKAAVLLLNEAERRKAIAKAQGRTWPPAGYPWEYLETRRDHGSKEFDARSVIAAGYGDRKSTKAPVNIRCRGAISHTNVLGLAGREPVAT